MDDDEAVYSHHVLAGTGTAGGLGARASLFVPNAAPPARITKTVALRGKGTSHRRLCLVGDTASQCSTVSTCFTLVHTRFGCQ